MSNITPDAQVLLEPETLLYVTERLMTATFS